ncbi:phosphate ABC transporter substrate-binding protein PstS [Hydrogenophaga sp. PAMC20947]|uniref:phosphate ABC transporter substrate-binding protein PstS n=1 Tax=Hydrogenophaga sp. PAMC20947 TaxID=2565558 RepID=UPI00109DD3A7|nr:phosphate ABC transporter substrate-binding protein PstS [Hydrogenophaga sp. PAMC20947]QCB47205.1 phosphate ABC transporter substrate-binding protein PstS [Hydrogenophaga sp. PAMC20947]
MKMDQGRRWARAGLWCLLGGALWLSGAHAAAVVGAPPAPAGQPKVVIDAAGATFPALVYQRWAQRYEAERQVEFRYQPTGSGDGIRKISAGQVQIGGTDSPLSAAVLQERGLLQLPTLAGAVVPVFNLGVGAPRSLRLSAQLLGDLFAGHTQHWDDPRIAALNPGVRLGHWPVQRVVRADQSGTTEAFTGYLSMVNPVFAAEVGTHKLPLWPGKTLAAEGNGGVVKLLQSTQGALAYTGYDRAQQDGLSMVELQNASGLWVRASELSILQALQASDVHRKGLDTASTLNRPGGGSWPITVVTFLLIHAQPETDQKEASRQALRFLYWAFQRGDALLRGTGFVPLPTAMQARLAKRLLSVTASDGGSLVFQ